MTADAVSRLVSLIERRVGALALNLRGCHVLTEGATGAYAVTPTIAAAAGATVTAFTRATRYGSVAEVGAQVMALARAAGVADRVQVIDELPDHEIARADIVTNAGHLRPLDAAFIDRMKAGAAIPLMYESWELRPGEVDLAACRRRGIQVAGTNECHAEIRVFEYLGMLAVLGLLKCGTPVCLSRVLLICDNPFAPHIAKTLLDCGAELSVLGETPLPESLRARCTVAKAPGSYDAVVVAATPGVEPIVGRAGAARYAADQIGDFGALVQVWGDVDRSNLDGFACYPLEAPRPGHMGILLNELGPEPIVRLQAGGLKVGEVLRRQPAAADPAWSYCQPVGGMA